MVDIGLDAAEPGRGQVASSQRLRDGAVSGDTLAHHAIVRCIRTTTSPIREIAGRAGLGQLEAVELGWAC